VKLARAALAVAFVAPAAAAQLADLQPGRNFFAEPNFGAARSFAVDVADAELDGDLDVITGNGGEGAAQLARIFINDGLGAFTDETATRFAGLPTMNNRDIEFFDADDDGDYDVFASCFTPGGASAGAVSRCFVNQGGAQAGAIGTFVDGTDAFWGALVAVPASQQVCGGCNSGPFREFGADADFADLDDDGDLDLFFGVAGPGTSGTRDSRVFLNDGRGGFDERWPWANATADTKLHSVDFEVADYDGDYDFDLVTAGLFSQGRVYVSNLYQAVGTSPYTDITKHALLDQGAPQTGNSAYESEFGDVDGDGDFDVWMGNYNNNAERLLRNNGPDAGGFGFSQMNVWIKNDPNVDEEEADFCDYDGDGDLDVFVANFSGANYLFQSGFEQGLDPDTQGLVHLTGSPAGLSPNPELPSNYNAGTSLRGEVADMDGDGDDDFILANDANQGNWLFRNVLGVPDAHAPEFAHFTLQLDKPNGTDTPIHAAARDNGPSQLHRYYDAVLVYAVDDEPPQSVPMSNQGGQQYRGVIPAQTDASIEYHVEVTDLAGNTGISARHSFVQGTLPIDPWTDLGSGLAGVAGPPQLVGTGPLTAGSAGALTLSDAAPSAVCALFVSLSSAPAPFKCGTLVPVPVALQLTLATNGAGALPLAWGSWPNGLSGASLYFQYAIADGAAVCGTALSNALRADVP
jgi:hypothetical protein